MTFLRCHCTSIAVLLLGFCSLATAADTVADVIVAAKQKHGAAVKSASDKLIFAIGERIKASAAAGDLDQVKELIAAKETFVAGGGIPIDPDLAEDSLRYLSARKGSASEVYRAYQAAIRNQTAALQIKVATVLDLDMKKFIADEKRALAFGSGVSDAAAAEAAVTKAKGTKELFDEWYQKYLEMMDQIADEPTTAKQENTHRELSNKLDDRIKSQTWTFRCTLSNVDEDNGKVTVYFDRPLETPGMTENWKCLSSASNLKISRQQALDLVPGDVLCVSGAPRFVSERGYSSNGFFSRMVMIGGQHFQHSLYITNFKHSIEKSKSSTKLTPE